MRDLVDDRAELDDEEDDESFASGDEEPRKRERRPEDLDDSSEEDEDDDNEEEARKVGRIHGACPECLRAYHQLTQVVIDPRGVHR